MGILTLNPLTLSWRRFVSYINQFIALQSKSMDWFLYDKDLQHERVNALFPKMVKHFESPAANDINSLTKLIILGIWFANSWSNTKPSNALTPTVGGPSELLSHIAFSAYSFFSSNYNCSFFSNLFQKLDNVLTIANEC